MSSRNLLFSLECSRNLLVYLGERLFFVHLWWALGSYLLASSKNLCSTLASSNILLIYLSEIQQVKWEKPDLKEKLSTRLKPRFCCSTETRKFRNVKGGWKFFVTLHWFRFTLQCPKGIQTFVDGIGICSSSLCWCVCTCSKPLKRDQTWSKYLCSDIVKFTVPASVGMQSTFYLSSHTPLWHWVCLIKVQTFE